MNNNLINRGIDWSINAINSDLIANNNALNQNLLRSKLSYLEY